MKHMKKIVSLLLALVMVLGMTVTPFAEGTTGTGSGSITVTNAVPGQTYTIYRIFDLESYNTTTDAYAYKVNTTWKNFIMQDGVRGVYVTVDSQEYVTWVSGADPAAFAKMALTYAKDHTIDNDGTATASGSSEGTSGATVTFTNLPLGYYLVDSTVGTLCCLNTTAPDMTVQDKQVVPTVDKKVQEDSTYEYGEKNSADIGQTVTFRTTIHAQPGAENYVLHDKMGAGLTFESVTSVKIGEQSLNSSTDYMVKTTGLNDLCSFEIAFTKSFLDTIVSATNSVIHVYYTAVLNDNAVVGSDGNPNETWLTYGEKQDLETVHSKTDTYTWKIPIFKYEEEKTTGENGSVTLAKVPLAGAKFKLCKDSEGNDPILLVQINAGSSGNGTKTYRAALSGEKNTVTEVESGTDGNIVIQGLDADTYYLFETKAPEGYNKLSSYVQVIINGTVNESEQLAAGDIKVDNKKVEKVEVKNSTGSLLPTTGGMGTTIFYVLGAVLVLAAVVLLVTKTRMNSKE